MGWHDKNRKRNKGHVTKLFEDKIPYGKNWYDKLFMEAEKTDDEEMDEMKDVEDEEEIEEGCDKKKKDEEEMEEEEGKDKDDTEDEEEMEEEGEEKLKMLMDMYKKASPQDKKQLEKMMDQLMNPDKHYDEEKDEDEEDTEQIDELMDTSFGGRVRNQKDPEYNPRRMRSKVHGAERRTGIGTPAADRLERMNLGDNEEDLEDDE